MLSTNGFFQTPALASDAEPPDTYAPPPAFDSIIRVENLDKSFGRLHVLNKINLQIRAGEITAIVGPNGSGKTTLTKSILGLAKPDSGQIFVSGQVLNGNWAYRKHIGYMPQIARFPENLRVKEILFMVKDLREKETELDEELLHKFGIEKEIDKPLRTLSGGTRQKVSATIAFLFVPDILILDEPTAGLDPAASSKLKEKILQEKSRGKTIILTSHIMSEVEELAENIVFLLDGRIGFQGKITDLKSSIGEHNLERSIARMMENQQQGSEMR